MKRISLYFVKGVLNTFNQLVNRMQRSFMLQRFYIIEKTQGPNRLSRKYVDLVVII